MASAEATSAATGDNSAEEAIADTATPLQSLFGPFPTPSDLGSSEQQGAGKDQITPSRESQIKHTEPSPTTLDLDPQVREPLGSITNKSASQGPSTPPPLTREKTAPAIGPATDKPTPFPKESEIEGPVLYITLLLSSTGARHPYKLDDKYLRKRSVIVEGNNPINISLYKLKELILRDWREEWEAKPSSPDSIRLISMGKMLNDKARLSDSGFKNGTTPHIIHMTIKPQEIVDEEDAKMKSGTRDRDGSERSPGCRCVVQ